MKCHICNNQPDKTELICSRCGANTQLFKNFTYEDKFLVDQAFFNKDFAFIWNAIEKRDPYVLYKYEKFITAISKTIQYEHCTLSYESVFEKIYKRHLDGDALCTYFYGKIKMLIQTNGYNDYVSGKELIKTATEKGEILSIGELGIWNYTGKVTASDECKINKKKAYEYLKKAAENKCIKSYRYFGNMLEEKSEKIMSLDKSQAINYQRQSENYLYAATYFSGINGNSISTQAIIEKYKATNEHHFFPSQSTLNVDFTDAY